MNAAVNSKNEHINSYNLNVTIIRTEIDEYNKISSGIKALTTWSE